MEDIWGGWGGANHVRCSSVAGTQTMDRCWKSLKTWMAGLTSVSLFYFFFLVVSCLAEIILQANPSHN